MNIKLSNKKKFKKLNFFFIKYPFMFLNFNNNKSFTMSDFQEMILRIQKCTMELALIVGIMIGFGRNDLNVPDIKAPCVKIPLGSDSEGHLWHLSLAVPPDANKYFDLPRSAETALFKNDKLVYVGDWGYSDVVRWDDDPRASTEKNVTQIIGEIDRLKALVGSV